MRYTNAVHERSSHMQYKDGYTLRDEAFLKKYNDLVRNLDGESVETVNLILERLRLLFRSDAPELDLFDSEEQNVLAAVKEKLEDRIFEVEPCVYAWKNYFLPQRYFDVNVYYHGYGLSRLKNLSEIRRGNVIDAGAFIGDSALMFAKLVAGRVYAMEAIDKNCDSIRKTVELNHLKNLEIVHKAVGSKSGVGAISRNQNLNWSTMSPCGSREYGEKTEISVTSIDDFVRENQLKVSLIKAHVEGMESELVRGAVETLRAQRPALLIHIHHTPEDFFGIKPFIENLGLGYRFEIYKPVNGNILTGAMLIAEVDRS